LFSSKYALAISRQLSDWNADLTEIAISLHNEWRWNCQ
jgi:hypothetical protein